MPQINDDTIFPITAVNNGATWIGSDPDGKTVQFSFQGLVDALKGELDVIYFNNATKSGQTVFGNLQGVAETTTASYNEGDPFIGVILNFPPVNPEDVYLLLKIKIR